MQLAEKALRCQELGADKTLSLGCIVIVEGETVSIADKITNNNNIRLRINGKARSIMFFDIQKNIGHPITRGRLCYLVYSKIGRVEKDEFLHLNAYFLLNPHLLNQTILERQHNEELMDLLLEFLESVK